MHKKIAAFIGILFSIAVLYVSTSRSCMSYIYANRIWGGPHNKWYSPYRSKGGDLTGMAYLDGIRKFVEPMSYTFEKAIDSTPANIHLLLYGDSYTKDIPDSAFACISHYDYGRRGYTNIAYTLDSNEKNILVIEIGERFLRDYFSKIFIFNNVGPDVHAATTTTPTAPFIAPRHYASFALPDLGFVDSMFNPNINQNIEQNVFNYAIINPIRILKATFNYHFFNRASGDVIVSKNNNALFLKETAITTGKPSSYSEITDQELFTIVNNINTIYDSYTQRGFKAVYLSIIPNPASILQPEGYNNLIPKVQNHPGMKVPCINVYDVFKADKDPARLYRQGDTHWNNKGMHIWLNMINAELQKLNNGK